MEDDDVDVTVTSAWPAATAKSPQQEGTLKRLSKVLSETTILPRVGYIDVKIEDCKEDRCSSDASEDSPSKNDESGSKIVFKGFKKRILAQAQENEIGEVRGNSQDNFHPVGWGGRAKRTTEGKRGKITEYAQYLGLQPASGTSKGRCSKCCNQTTNSCAQSPSNTQNCTCLPDSPTERGFPGVSDSPVTLNTASSSPSTANKFKITRKVYLCAACGTYFENWNLFLHMREIHKRHICLFCLGMFGQAERLSYHLAKKHSVPERSFTSVEDFHNVFKGSCYLICCTCEKVFSETDNFYNHFCSPVQKVRGEVCSLCRQTGGHSVTCSQAEMSHNNSGVVPGISETSSKDGLGVHNKKRLLKNSRFKRRDESLLTSHQQKSSDLHARKMKMKSRESPREAASSGDETAISVASEILETATTTSMTMTTTSTTTTTTTTSLPTETESKSSRDTVSETIMEVSTCKEFPQGTKMFPEAGEVVVEVCAKSNSGRIDLSPCPSPSASPSRSLSPLRRQSDASLYDSVVETIMEVSRCSDKSMKNVGGDYEDEIARRDSGSEADALVMDDVTNLDNDEESAIESERYDDRLRSPKSERRKKAENSRESEAATDSDDECSSNASATRLNSTGDTDISFSSPEKESQTSSVTITRVNATDRSLVIKICTNRNSQLTVSSANGPSYNENHDTSRESEENNNGEDSADEKHSGRASANSCRGEDEEDEEESHSDADSEKLAVVDEEKTKVENKEDEKSLETENIQIDETCDENNQTNEENAVSQPFENCAIDAIDDKSLEDSDGIILAAEDVPSIDLNVEGLLETMEIEDLLKRCISVASGICVYCNHARHIAVNGKQLSLHVLAEHRFQPQHPAIIIQREQFTARVKKSINDVDASFFNLDSFDTARGTFQVQKPRVFECFHCRFHSHVHKDIYLHNRKMHQKTILICIMCKSTFYSYSELLCHLCPGVYSPNINVTYRCCLCTVSDLPSAFRLMVHLRKKHHSCDVCLESTGNQQRLSNHVWKHKLHHLCYRCGIAYRNKPDITKHLFWKHGTESVLCKKCLQKKWPHVFHFCIPPTAFVCEECTSTFSRAVALKVHKRLHSGDRPYDCDECAQRFISRKLLAKHKVSHREPEKIEEIAEPEKTPGKDAQNASEAAETTEIVSTEAEKPEITTIEVIEPKEVVKKVVDVYDLPPLNLSSDSDSDSDEPASVENAAKVSPEEVAKSEEVKPEQTVQNSPESAIVDGSNTTLDPEVNEEAKNEEAQIMDGIWDNFKSYAASLENPALVELTAAEKDEEARRKFLCEIIDSDHDYCIVSKEKCTTEELEEDPKIEDNCGTMEGEHDYGYKQTKSPSTSGVALNCDSDNGKKKKEKTPKKKKQNGNTSSSDSSSDSDSSSCSCGTNCSCSSSSSGSSSSSSSSSDSDSSASENSPKKTSMKKERKKEKDKETTIVNDSEVGVQEENAAPSGEIIAEATLEPAVEEVNHSIEVCEAPPSPQLVLRESDLDTDETETDEDFYDEHPQELANKLLAEKRNQLTLLAAVAPASTELPRIVNAAPATNYINNGALDAGTTLTNDVISTETRNARGQSKKRVKTKKRKKAERANKNTRVTTPTVESIKLNIPKSFYQKKQTGFASATPAIITVLPSRSSTPSFVNSQPETPSIINDTNKNNSRICVGGSSSENENKRSSKRKRVPKRFYGDSSDEEAERQHQQQQLQQQPLQYTQPSIKWRKVENTNSVPVFSSKPQPKFGNSTTKNVTLRLSGFDQEPLERIVSINTRHSATESEEPAESSSAESSEAEENSQIKDPQPVQEITETTPTPINPVAINPLILPTNSTRPERSVNLYCYCQCPYDEVSEMIACDGNDCRIEWFHFECVGIMVPPKGKWYCPDCRKRDGLPSNDELIE